MSYHGWHVGMKVVCIKEGGWTLSPGAYDANPSSRIFPLHGQILTIREMDEWHGEIYLKFEEIVNPITPPSPEASFLIEYFRPVQPRKTDISAFKAMLSKTKVPA